MIEITNMMREELEKANFRVSGERVRTNLEISNPWEEPTRCSSKALTKLEEMRQRSFMGIFRFLSLQKWDLKDRDSWQPHTREGEGHANEGWQIKSEVVSKVSTDFDNILFETVVKSV